MKTKKSQLVIVGLLLLGTSLIAQMNFQGTHAGSEPSIQLSFSSFTPDGTEDEETTVVGLEGKNALAISKAIAYPSPAINGETSIGFRVTGTSTDLALLLYDSYGNQLYKKEINAIVGYNKIPINTASLGFSLSSGVYYFILKKNDEVISKGKFGVLGGKQ